MPEKTLQERPYYAQGREVFRRQACRKNSAGRQSVTMGFKVCTVADHVDVEHVVFRLNVGEAFLNPEAPYADGVIEELLETRKQMDEKHGR